MTLAVVQDATLGGAGAEADAIRRAARERADRLLAETRDEATAVIARRRAAAEQLATAEERERLGRARAAARATVLEAQRAILVEASVAARAAVRGVVGDPRYEPLIERLSVAARERLAGTETVEVVPAVGGGVIVRAGSRELDYSLDAQTDRCLQAIGDELEGLWR